MSEKKAFKAFVLILTLLFTVSSYTGVCAAEVEVTDWSINLCKENEIFLNEDFADSQLPQSDSLGTWQFRNGTPTVENGVYSISDTTYSVYTLNNPITYNSEEGADNKYMLRYDFTRAAGASGNLYPVRYIYGTEWIKEFMSVFDEGYSFTLSNAPQDGSGKHVVYDIPADTWITVEHIFNFGEEVMTLDLNIYSADGTLLGSRTNYQMSAGKTDSSVGLGGFLFCTYTDVSNTVKFDNIQFYPLREAKVADPTITEETISGIPEMIEGSNFIINENFDDFPETVLSNSYTGSDSSIWSFATASVNAESKILSTGRKVLKLSDKSSYYAAVSPSRTLVYGAESENRYVITFGVKIDINQISDSVNLLKFKDSNDVLYEILNITENGILKSVRADSPEFQLETKWYSFAVTCDLRDGYANVKTIVTDGENQQIYPQVTMNGFTGIDEIIYAISSVNGGTMYLDNVSMYNAVTTPPQKPEARNMEVTGVCYRGRVLTGKYTYYDVNQDEEGDTSYYWVRSNEAEGGEYTKIDGTDMQLTYTLQSEDIGKYVSFAVIPKKAVGYDEPTGNITYKLADSIIAEEPARLDLNELISSNLGAADLSNVTSDLILRIKGSSGSEIVWATEDSSVIGTDGTVKRQASDREITLTATITSPDGKASETFDFVVTVKAKSTSGGGGSGSSGSSGENKNNHSIYVSNDLYTSDANKPIDRPTHKYNDVANNHWAMEYIQELYHREIAQGNENNNFEPERNITREEFAKMIVTAFDLEDNTAVVEFNDVDKEAWYYPYVASAYKSLIVDGIGNNEFGTGKYISRQDMAVIAYRTCLVKNLTLKEGKTAVFSDKSEIADYAVDAAITMQQAGIMCGSGNNEFRPRDFATRAEVAKIIVYLLNNSAE